MVWLDVFTAQVPAGGALAIGNFDGVHRGHQEVLGRLGIAAQELGVQPAVLVPDPHPLAVLGQAPRLLTLLPLRGRLLEEAGVRRLVRLPFDRAVAHIAPDEFVQRILLGRLRPRVVVVGFNFTYGEGARGRVDDLRVGLAGAGIRLDVVPPTLLGGLPVSSSRVRAALAEGDLQTVSLLLGRAHTLQGTVRPGHRRGREIGFPTANVHCPQVLAAPAPGVYAVRCRIGAEVFAGVCNLGPRPTFDEVEEVLEVHLFDMDRDLYGQAVEVDFIGRIRGQVRFSGVSELREQIAKDASQAKEMLGVAGP